MFEVYHKDGPCLGLLDAAWLVRGFSSCLFFVGIQIKHLSCFTWTPFAVIRIAFTF